MDRAAITSAIIVCLLLFSPTPNSAIYKWFDENGNVHFSDTKPQNTVYEDIEKTVLSGGNFYNATIVDEQQQLIEQLPQQIVAGDPQKTDIFFVGFAGDAKQDVFMKETLYAKALFDKQYNAMGKSIALINNVVTTDRYLVASNKNLERALIEVGKKMGEEDVLYLYLTSHGSRDHQLSVDFPPHTVKDFGGVEIRQMLDKAGIKWRIVVVSACFSGGFIEPLKNDYSVIATAADAYNTSFGCADNRDFTFYGEAIFKHQMQRGVGVIESLDKAREVVRAMEEPENLTPSNPQLWIGALAKEKIKEI